MRFQECLDLCKNEGKKIYREGWNGKDQYVINFANCELSIYDEDTGSEECYPMDDKDDGYTTTIFEATKINDCKILDFLLIKTQQGFITSWVPSISDIQAEDWSVKNE